jgi:hypothetical protein
LDEEQEKEGIKMTREQTIEAIRIMQAFLDGKEVISQFVTSPQATDNPSWNWVNDISAYRIKPTATLRPWTADEVPLGCQLRHKSYNPDHRSLITTSGHTILREGWLNEFEHSIDGGKTWIPCGVMEDAK